MVIGKREIGKISYEDTKKIIKGFEQCWESTLKQIGKLSSQKAVIEKSSLEFRMKADDFENQVVQFQEFLQKVPVLSAIKAWLEGKLSDPQWKERFFDCMTLLINKNLIPLVDSRGNLISLEYFMENSHQAILEDIRSVQGWSMFEKENIVQCYVAFSQYLARISHNLIPYGVDPDRERVQQKALSYESFIDFIPHLSARDALIAKLLYFYDIPMDEILNLKRTSLNKANHTLELSTGQKPLTRHLFAELLDYSNNAEKSQKLLFTNVRGAQVDRTHLHQTFSRACEKTSKKEKITPGTLLKIKNQQDTILDS